MSMSRRVLLGAALVVALLGAQLALLAWERSDPEQFGVRDRYREEPATTDEDYHRTFLYLLPDQLGAMRFEANRGGTARQHERTLRERREKIEELERRYLNSEPLGSGMRIHRPDGTVFEHDGRPHTAG